MNVVLGQELAPRHSSTISSLLMGAAWGVGALVVAPIGVLADAFGLRVALAALTGVLRAGLLCALALPVPRGPVAEPPVEPPRRLDNDGPAPEGGPRGRDRPRSATSSGRASRRRGSPGRR